MWKLALRAGIQTQVSTTPKPILLRSSVFHGSAGRRVGWGPRHLLCVVPIRGHDESRGPGTRATQQKPESFSWVWVSPFSKSAKHSHAN